MNSMGRSARLGWCVGLSALCLASCGPSQPAYAQTALHSVGGQTARGTYETGIQQIVLGTTQGVNLSFVKTGETVQKVWLDDPTWVVLDFDGCLPGASEISSSSSGCQSNGATIIHLRQLPQPISGFPQQLFTGTGHSTYLTVLTSGSSSGTQIYQFKLIAGQGNPPYSVVEIIPPPPPTSAQMVSVSQQYQQAILQQLSQGLAYAEAQKLVDPNSSAYSSVQSMIALMQNGTPFDQAMEQTNTPRALIDRLRSYGSRRSN